MKKNEAQYQTKTEILQDKLRGVLHEVRGCLSMKEDVPLLEDIQFDDFWETMQQLESDLSSMKAECYI